MPYKIAFEGGQIQIRGKYQFGCWPGTYRSCYFSGGKKSRDIKA